MAKGKSNYTFTINASQQTIDNLIQNFLNANDFKQFNEKGITYYKSHNMMWGNQFLEYSIQDNNVKILAYIGSYKNPYSLNNGFTGNVAEEKYKSKLISLFTELDKLNIKGENIMQQTEQNQTNTNQSEMTNQNINQFAENVNKSKETMAIIGFIISIIGLLLSCFGVSFGAIILLLEIYFAINGLKTAKRGLSIATLIISGVTFLILIAQIILTVMFA